MASSHDRGQTRRHGALMAIAIATLSLVAGCAGLDADAPPMRRAPSSLPPPGASQGPASIVTVPGPSSGPGTADLPRSAAADAPAAERPAGAGPGAVTSRAATAPDWVAVFESGRDAAYGDQRVIYVDRGNFQEAKVENLTYYLARTREVKRTESRAKIQELAVICEGTPIAPATSLRGEGTEEGSGTYSVRPAGTALTSVSQFSTQKLRLDPANPTTFVVRAICLMGMEGKR